MKTLRPLFWLPLLLPALLAEAHLEWKTTEAHLPVRPAQCKATAEFRFQNTGTNAIDFLSLRPSCGCLSIYPEKKRYQGGESGTLRVQFDLSGRTGHQEKSVRVVTSDAPGKIQTLKITADIPESYRLSATRLRWEKSRRDARYATLVNVSGTPLRIKRATSSSPWIKTRLEVVREGFEYRVWMAPDKDCGRVLAVIRIETIPPDGMKESAGFRIYARVE